MTHVGVIIPAGGIGKRMGRDRPKQFIEINRIPVLVHTLNKFQSCPRITEIVLVAPADHVQEMQRLLDHYPVPKVRQVVPGGKERQDSVCNGFKVLSDSIDVVLIHDAVRPFVSLDKINAVIDAIHRSGAALLAVPESCTLKQVVDGKVIATVDRSALWQAQTPQGATRDLLMKAFQHAEETGFRGTDDVSLIEAMGHPVTVVPGDNHNIKITSPEDLIIAEALLKTEAL